MMSKRNQNPELSKPGRRAWLKGAATLAGGALLPAALEAGTKTAPTANGCAIAVSAGGGKAVVETTAGKVSGYVRNGIFTSRNAR
jgi:hypothetical protein